MRAKLLIGAVAALLVAAAFFLPELLLTWGDEQLLDNPHMESQDEEREGFGESIQLTVPEKIMLLRSGQLTVMDLDRTRLQYTAETYAVVFEINGAREEALLAADGDEQYAEEIGQMWEARLASARTEIRSLQALGGLPEVWRTDDPPEYTGQGDLLYLDPDTHMSFQVYQLSLEWENWSVDLLVDAQSERILSFTLQWDQDGRPNWGPRGASGFGSAWRDYWKMDSVSTGWYNEYTRSVLENLEAQLWNSGDYAAREQITFMYDSQSLAVPLSCQGARPGNFAVFAIAWNR